MIVDRLLSLFFHELLPCRWSHSATHPQPLDTQSPHGEVRPPSFVSECAGEGMFLKLRSLGNNTKSPWPFWGVEESVWGSLGAEIELPFPGPHSSSYSSISCTPVFNSQYKSMGKIPVLLRCLSLGKPRLKESGPFAQAQSCGGPWLSYWGRFQSRKEG